MKLRPQMADGDLTDDELRLRVRMIGAGIWLSVVLLGAVGIWIASTWGDPGRGGMVAMDGAAAVVTVASLVAVEVVSWAHGVPGASPADPVYLAGLMLALAVTGIMCTVQARTQAEIRRELRRVSRVDPLPGALNRRGLTERLDAELGRAAAGGSPGAATDRDGTVAEILHRRSDQRLDAAKRGRTGDAAERGRAGAEAAGAPIAVVRIAARTPSPAGPVAG